jgi:photosynthetic reaction center H subunit
MPTGALTSHLDVAQVTLYAFWIFFALLILYLRREDRREGYPLINESTGKPQNDGYLTIPDKKIFRLFHGGTTTSPQPYRPEREIKAKPATNHPGSPLIPTGNPMIDGVGPAAWVQRQDVPDLTYDGLTRIAPLRVATDHAIDEHDRDPRGFTVYGADGVKAGKIRDAWLDRSEVIIRYLEVTTPKGRNVLVPFTLSKIDQGKGKVVLESILGAQIEDAPKLANPDRITRLEEDKVCAYFAGGILYATPARQEPLL